jgi:multidrug/hemolysin transport system permease protein
MSEIKAMTKRNLLIYFRNKSAVFFSILSALILLAIMVVFLGESSSEGLLDALN